MRVWSYTLAKTLASLILWIVITSFLGVYTICVIPFNFVCVYLALKCSYTKKSPKAEETISEGVNDETDWIFYALASLLALWIPCVPGHKKNMLLTAAVASLLAKLAILGLAICLSASGLQPSVNPNPTFLLCVDPKSQIGDLTPCSFHPDQNNSKPLIHCFHGLSDTEHIERMYKITKIFNKLKALQPLIKDMRKM